MASPNYITHIRFARHLVAPYGLMTPYQFSSLPTVQDEKWKVAETDKKSVCEAICLSGFCGYEIYRHRQTGNISKIVLYTNTTPQIAYELNSNMKDVDLKHEDHDEKQMEIWSQAWNSLKKVVLPGSRFHDISIGTKAVDRLEFLRENQLVKRMRLSRGNVLASMNAHTASGFLQNVHFEFLSKSTHGGKDGNSMISPALAYEHFKYSSGQSLVRGGPSLYYSSANPSIFSPRRQSQNDTRDMDEMNELNNRDIFWMGAMACVILFAGYLLNRCSQSKYDEQ